MMMRGLGITEGETVTGEVPAIDPCAEAGFLTDADYGFGWGFERWIPSSTASVSWTDKAGKAFTGLFNPVKWACQPTTQIGTIIPPLVAIVAAIAILKRSSRR